MGDSTVAHASLTMIDNFDINGIWKGEYVYEDKFQPTILKTAIPFVLRIKSSRDFGLFTGICQDDPELSKIELPANIYGTVRDYEVFFVKKFPKTLILESSGELTIGDEPHPDIIYRAKITNEQVLSGTWQIERTFRKVNGRVTEIPKIGGHWRAERF